MIVSSATIVWLPTPQGTLFRWGPRPTTQQGLYMWRLS